MSDAVLDPNDGTILVGVLNVTPDSFSDGGRYVAFDDAVAHGLRLAGDGAHLVDVGGESTRPGAEQVDAAEERRRVVPVIEALVAEGVRVSIDTAKPDVAEAAIAVGAVVVNDVTALRADGMARVCADGGVGVVLMHMQGDPRTMQVAPTYDDVVEDIRDFLAERVAAVSAAGVAAERIAVDPGIGFGKTIDHNLVLLAGLTRFTDLGRPVMIGASRKRFLGTLTGRDGDDRDVATAATVALAVQAGASIVRVHNVAFAADAAAVAEAMVSPGRETDGQRTQAT